MIKFSRIVFCSFVFACLIFPSLRFFGAKEDFVKLSGWEKKATVPELALSTWTNRTFQSAFTEDWSKTFYLRKTCLRTAFQLRDWFNFGLFHYGFGGVQEGRDGVIFEKTYTKYHLNRDRTTETNDYAAVVETLKEFDAYAKSIGADFVYMPMPDKLQTYGEYLPRWFDWFWGFSVYDAQTKVGNICRKAGIKVFDVQRYLLDRKPQWECWVYPPGGAHLNAYGSGLFYNGLADFMAKEGSNRLKFNRFLGVRPRKEVWSVDDDISLLMNTWCNSHLAANPHFTPVFEQTNGVMNAGSMISFGDCFREQVAKICSDARLFAPDKIIRAKRYDQQKPEGFRHVAQDVRLVVMVYQSFNSDRLPGCRDEIRTVFNALRAARNETAD